MIDEEYEPDPNEIDLYTRCLFALGAPPSLSRNVHTDVSIVGETMHWARQVDQWYLDYMHVKDVTQQRIGHYCPGYQFRRRFVYWCRENGNGDD